MKCSCGSTNIFKNKVNGKIKNYCRNCGAEVEDDSLIHSISSIRYINGDYEAVFNRNSRNIKARVSIIDSDTGEVIEPERDIEPTGVYNGYGYTCYDFNYKVGLYNYDRIYTSTRTI